MGGWVHDAQSLDPAHDRDSGVELSGCARCRGVAVGLFGFAERVRIGEDHRAQMSVGDAAVIVADTGGSRHAPDPAVITVSVTVRVTDVRKQRDRAVEQGGTILMEPTDLPFGERQCTVLDPWGHHWTFSQTIADVAPEEWGGETVDAW